MQNFGMTSKTFEDKNFIGDHPPIMMPGILSGGSHVSGTVVGIVTASGKYVQLDSAASDGSQTAAAILYGDLDASAEDEPGVFMNHGEAIDHYLTWPEGISDSQKAAAIAQLKTVNIYVK
ncbi:MAG: head decoration protein [Desulfobacteraceae bacterium]|nr:head decoration protein [Desulfobacteraceae bacterium]